MKFLLSEHLSKTFKIAWRKQAFITYLVQLRCTYLFKRGDQIEKSIWFQMGTIYSVAQWIVYLLQCEIKMAYVESQKNKKFKKERVKNIYEFVKSRYPTIESMKSIVQKTIVDKFLKDDIASQNYKSSKNFLTTKCMDRIKDEYNGHEYLVEYSWYYENMTNDNFKILTETSSYFKSQYEEWLGNRALQSIFQLEQKEKENKINKRKRKKQKLKSKALQKQKQKQKLQQMDQKLNNNSQSDVQINKVEQKKIQMKLDQQVENLIEIQIEQKLSQDKFDQKQQQKEEETTQIILKEQKKYKSDKDKQKLANKKIIKQRINQYYQFFASQLTQTAISFDKYRKITWSVIRSFIQTQIMGVSQEKMEEQNDKTQWKLQIYGSASAGFSLKHSDLDLVLLTNNVKISLNDIYYKLKVQQWSIDCKLIQAHVPIVTLKVNLCSAPFVKKQLSSKQFKKIQGQLFSVDLTLASIYQPHSGIQNTKQLKSIFESYPTIRNICTLLKEYLRVRKLNKPYTGGIGSYILIIMVHAILSRKNVLGSKQEQKADEYRMIKQISSYLENEFRPFETVISCQKNSKIKADNTIHLNIMSPEKEQLLKTSAFHIIKIINEFRKLREFQEQVEKEMQGMNINEKRNMKNYFIKAFNEFLYEKQE